MQNPDQTKPETVIPTSATRTLWKKPILEIQEIAALTQSFAGTGNDGVSGATSL